MANYDLEGVAGAAEVYLTLWESTPAGDGATGRGLRRRARQAGDALDRFARVFPIARPRADLCRGRFYRLAGRRPRAARAWCRSLQAAERLEMPFEEGLVHFEIGRHAEPGDAARPHHLDRARTLFARLGAAHDLARVE